MQLKFIQTLAGADYCHNPGDELDVPDAEAERLVAAGIAVPVHVAPVLETATTKRSPADELASLNIDPRGSRL